MLQRPKRSGATVSVRIEPGSASPYLKAGVLRSTYTEVALDGIPDALLVLPALGTVVTVAMAGGVPDAGLFQQGSPIFPHAWP